MAWHGLSHFLIFGFRGSFRLQGRKYHRFFTTVPRETDILAFEEDIWINTGRCIADIVGRGSNVLFVNEVFHYSELMRFKM